MKNRIIVLVIIKIFITVQIVDAQSIIYLTPGAFFNGNGNVEFANAVGLSIGLEYMQFKEKRNVYSIELRTKYGYYGFDDGTKSGTDSDGNYVPPKNLNEARLEYGLFSPQIGIVPKFHHKLDESFTFFIESELAVGIITGKIKYKGFDNKVNITKPFFCNNICVGIEFDTDDVILGCSFGYSTLNYHNNIKKSQPSGFKETIPSQKTPILFNFFVKIPLRN